MFHSSSSLLKRVCSRRTWSRVPCRPEHIRGPSDRLVHTPRSGKRTSHNRPPPLTPDYPYPRIGVGVLRGSRASTQAHLSAQVQHIVVDLEEPRSLRPTIGGPASGAMRHPAYQLLRIPLPRTQVNRGRGEPPSARVGTFRDVPSEAQHSYALFPDIIDA